MNYKYTKIDEVIERVFANHPFAENNFQWSDALEWVGSLIKLMNIPKINIHKVAKINIENYKGELPLDLFQVETFRNKDTKRMMGYTGDPYFKNLHCSDSQCLNCVTCHEEDKYQLSNNFIFTSFEEGTVEIAYYAIPIDDNGFPLIPDDESTKSAIEWHIAMKLAYKEWMTDKLSRDKYQYIEQQRNWYVAKAMNSNRVPDIHQMEAIKNFSLRLIPKINVLDNQFKFERERRINHNTNNFTQGTQL
jgi:hypothetical protein